MPHQDPECFRTSSDLRVLMNEKADELDSKLLLGRYRVVRKLGEGGMGTVHLARVEGAEGFTRPVVVKRVRGDLRATDEGNRLFKREAQILSKMQHPGITNIIDFGVEDRAHIMVLEYVHGYTLAPWLDFRHVRSLPVPVDVGLYIVRRVLDALHYAHHFDTEDGNEIEIVHRDVAPDNVLLSKKGYVHLLDFGIASMSGADRNNATNSGVFRGKLGYAAPETVEGKPASPRSDQYSAAALLLELLTLETPFFSDSVGETVLRMVNEVPAAPSTFRSDIPAGLDEILARALEKKPEARFDSASEFARELRAIQSEDDEEVAAKLKRIVRYDFAALPAVADVEPLKVREEALARIFPKGITDGMRDSIVSTEELGAGEVPTVPAEAEKSIGSGGAERRLQGLLLAILVVGGVIAIGVGAGVALLSRGGAASEQVFVVGGESDEEVTPVPMPPLAEADDLQVQVEGEDQPLPRATANPHKSGASLNTTGAAASPLSAEERQKALVQAVQSQSSSYQGCFVKHVTKSESAPEVILHFSVAAQGGKGQVNVEPASVATSALGGCLKTAASRASFPRLSEGVSFRVPVRARFARFE